MLFFSKILNSNSEIQNCHRDISIHQCLDVVHGKPQHRCRQLSYLQFRYILLYLMLLRLIEQISQPLHYHRRSCRRHCHCHNRVLIRNGELISVGLLVSLAFARRRSFSHCRDDVRTGSAAVQPVTFYLMRRLYSFILRQFL